MLRKKIRILFKYINYSLVIKITVIYQFLQDFLYCVMKTFFERLYIINLKYNKNVQLLGNTDIL